MNKYTLFIIYLFVSSTLIYCQNTDTTFYKGSYSFIVDSIYISGNNKTKNEIILKEITCNIGDTVNSKILEYNKERIYSLGLFTSVRAIPYKINNKSIIEFKVEESWYIYPVPFLQLKDRDWNKLSYGLAFLMYNFRGRNETLAFRGALGYDPSLQFSYRNPYLILDKNISFDISLNLQKVRSQSNIAKRLAGYDFDKNVYSVNITVGKRLNIYNKVNLSASFSSIEIPFYIRGISASDNRVDNLFSLAFNYSFDNRDLRQFPSEGFYTSSLFQLKGLGIDGIAYQVFNFDIRKYFKLFNKFIFKGRFASRFTFGNLIPYYDKSFLGFNERIRGHFYDEMEGNNYYWGSVEADIPIIKDFNIKLDFLPLLPRSLVSYRVALYLQLFADTGMTQNKNEALSINKLNSGYGIGLTLLILPYDVFRLERAWDEFGNPEWIFDVGVSF